MISNFEKHIYNAHLAISRACRNKPFRVRENFEDFETDSDYVNVKKLSIFFNSYKSVDVDTFFRAPYEIYDKQDWFDLQFFTTQKALKTYTLYQTRKENEHPDTKNQLFFIKDSLKFILSFCRAKNITIGDYIFHKDDKMNTFLIHLKERKISIYVLFGLIGAEKILYSLPEDIKGFMFKELFNKIDTFRTRFASSSKAKFLVHEGLKKLQNITNNR